VSTVVVGGDIDLGIIVPTRTAFCAWSQGRSQRKAFRDQFPFNADRESLASITISQAVFDQIQSKAKLGERLAGQISRGKFEQFARSFVEESFSARRTLRPGTLSKAAEKNPEIKVLLGSDYVIVPDVLVGRETEPDEIIDREDALVDDSVAL
jgi:NgoMIV restriction enzyme